MIVACSACHGRFEAAGYRDPLCPACGAMAQPAGVRPCPRCELSLAPREVGGLVIDECSRCRGLFLDDVAIQRVLADDQHARGHALLAALPRSDHNPLPPAGGKMYVKCPTCSTVMNRKLFATGSGVVVDVCKKHGTFFDTGELPAIIEFVQNGGLAKAATKDAQRRSEQAKHDAVMRARAASDGNNSGADLVDGAALAELLFYVFS
jgi:Zn-finger nucleic acid-binding protein